MSRCTFVIDAPSTALHYLVYCLVKYYWIGMGCPYHNKKIQDIFFLVSPLIIAFGRKIGSIPVTRSFTLIEPHCLAVCPGPALSLLVFRSSRMNASTFIRRHSGNKSDTVRQVFHSSYLLEDVYLYCSKLGK